MVTKMDKLLESVKALAKELGLEQFDQYTITGAAGLMIAHGTSTHDGVFTEAIHRYTLDGHVFDPSGLTKEERREWVKKLKAAHATQLEMARYLDVSQALISRDLLELGLR